MNEAIGPSTWSSKGPTCAPSSTSWVVSVAATIWPVSASRPRCNLRQDRRVLVPCFSISHSPGPHSFRPVLSTSRCTGSVPDRGRGTSSVSARRLRVVWSGTERARPSRPMMEPISPSVWRRAKRNTALRVRAVVIARSESFGWPPGVVRGPAAQAATAASVNQTGKLPRWRRLASYSAQFATLCFCLGMWWRRSWFSLNGKVGFRGSGAGRTSYATQPPPQTSRSVQQGFFQLHGADSAGAVVFRKKLRRGQLLAFLATLPPCTVAMEACASAHYWGREIAKLGHTVRLIAPAYVKPFVKRQKNDMADAEAICEAAQRPTMRFVALKSANQQAAAVVFRTRDLLVRQRTQAINALRGHLTEFGVIAAKGPVHTSKLIAALEDPASDLPQAARGILAILVEQLRSLDERVAVLDREIARHAKENAVARRLMTIPGIGAVTAAAFTALAPPAETFRRGRDFAAWLGLTPVQRSSGGKERLGKTSKMGERSLRRLLIIGASAVARWAARKGVPAGSWLGRMLARKPRRCWCGWRWPTRWPGSSGHCWPRVAFIELRSRRCRRRHDREAVEAWEGQRRGMAHGQETGSGKPAATSASSAWA